MPIRLTPLDFSTAAVEGRALTFTARWQELLRLLFGDVAAVSSLPAIINRKTMAELNALGLGAGDANYLAFETDTGHLLRWTGSAWEFAPGDDGNGYFQDFAITPDAAKWAPCNGVATSYLTVGVTLSVTPFTPPDFNGTAAYRKSAAAYSATINPAGGTTGAEAPGVSGTTSQPSATTGVDTNFDGVTTVVATATHTHTEGSLAVDSHDHPVGTIDMPHVDVVVFFRR